MMLTTLLCPLLVEIMGTAHISLPSQLVHGCDPVLTLVPLDGVLQRMTKSFGDIVGLLWIVINLRSL